MEICGRPDKRRKKYIKLETFRTQILSTHAPSYRPNLFLNQKLPVFELTSFDGEKFRPWYIYA